MKRFVAALLAIFSVAPVFAASWPGSSPTGTAVQWGLNKTVTPYQIGVFLGTSWYSIGTITSGGAYLPTFTMTGDCTLSAGAITCTALNGYAIGQSGAKIPLLSGVNTWSASQIFSGAATFSSTVAINGSLTLGGSFKLDVVTIATLPQCNSLLLGSLFTVSNGTAYATGTYGSAVSATGAVTRVVICTNTGGSTTYAWAYN